MSTRPLAADASGVDRMALVDPDELLAQWPNLGGLVTPIAPNAPAGELGGILRAIAAARAMLWVISQPAGDPLAVIITVTSGSMATVYGTSPGVADRWSTFAALALLAHANQHGLNGAPFFGPPSIADVFGIFEMVGPADSNGLVLFRHSFIS